MRQQGFKITFTPNKHLRNKIVVIHIGIKKVEILIKTNMTPKESKSDNGRMENSWKNERINEGVSI